MTEEQNITDAALLYARMLGYAVKAAVIGLCSSYMVYIIWGDHLAVTPATIATNWSESSGIFKQAVRENVMALDNTPLFWLDAVPKACIMFVALISLGGMCLAGCCLRAAEKHPVPALGAFADIGVPCGNIGLAQHVVLTKLPQISFWPAATTAQKRSIIPCVPSA